MATISSLPVELLFAIGEYFDPGDCFDFALTCKNNWVAFKSTVERHQQLHGEYRHVVTKREERTIWNLLNTSLARPDVAYHIKQLTLTHDRDYGYLSGRSHSPWKPQGGVPGKDITRYIKVASENSFLTAAPHDPEFESLRRRFRKEVDVYQIIRNGADGPLIPVLLFLLPRLRELRYCDGGDDHWLLHSLRHLADAYDRLGTTSNVSLPLGCLTTAYISHDEDSRQRIDWAFVHCIIRIPTLRSFTGHMVGGDLHPLEETLFEGRPLRSDAPTSNVEELVFSYSGIGPNAFEAILSLTKNLKRFHYQHSNYIHDPPYDAWRIVAALRQYCGNSLERLELAAVDSVCEVDDKSWACHPILQLPHFEKLKAIRLELTDIVPSPRDIEGTELERTLQELLTLTPPSESPSQTLPYFYPSMIFPHSLEQLHMSNSHYEFFWESRWQPALDILLEAKETHLVNLKSLYFSEPRSSTSRKEIVEILAASGIAFKEIPLFVKEKSIFTGESGVEVNAHLPYGWS